MASTFSKGVSGWMQWAGEKMYPPRAMTGFFPALFFGPEEQRLLGADQAAEGKLAFACFPDIFRSHACRLGLHGVENVEPHVDERGHNLVCIATGVHHDFGAKLVGQVVEFLKSRAKDIVKYLCRNHSAILIAAVFSEAEDINLTFCSLKTATQYLVRDIDVFIDDGQADFIAGG